MATTVFPVVVSSGSSGPSATSITCASPFVAYGAALPLTPAIYTITCTSTTIAKVEFFSSDTVSIGVATTVSGSVSYNLATAATKVVVWTDTGSNIVVTITLTASALSDTLNKTLDTITSSSTYTGTSTSGYAYFLMAGGGGGGGNSNQQYGGGGGGGSGGFRSGIVQLTGSMAIVIGAGGTAPGGTGGSTTFAGFTCTGGGGGGTGGASAGGTAGSPNGSAGGSVGGGGSPYGTGGSGGVNLSPYSYMTKSNYIGTSGQGGGEYTNVTAGTISGGGGGGASSRGGGQPGGAGIVYILRF
jgi:hypothetical protein